MEVNRRASLGHVKDMLNNLELRRSVVVDYTIHLLLVLTTFVLISTKQGITAVVLALLMNVIYLGEFLDIERRRQYCVIVDFLSQFFQAISNPQFSFLMGAVNSYFSLTRLRVSLMAMFLSHCRIEIAMSIYKLTGLQVCWWSVTYLQDGKPILEIQLAFATIASILKSIEAYHYYELHRSQRESSIDPTQSEAQFMTRLQSLPRATH